MTEDSASVAPHYLEYFYRILEKHTGIYLDHSKEYLVSSRLSVIARNRGFPDYGALLKHLFLSPIGHPHWECFEAMTTNETMFFRDVHPFESLKNHILPALIKKNSEEKKLHIWCAASSTGQEPYSLAMLIKEAFPDLASWTIRIRATDISESAIKKSMAGIYNETEMSRGLSAQQIQTHFTQLENGCWQRKPELKNNIVFERLNLVEEWPVPARYDLILLRNVLIYFKHETKLEVINKLYDHLADEGSVLMLGSSESLLYEDRLMMIKHDRISYYQKRKT
jgi:chemotaxis protein methyltransferase CheR